jgi:hypothetical protein
VLPAAGWSGTGNAVCGVSECACWTTVVVATAAREALLSLSLSSLCHTAAGAWLSWCRASRQQARQQKQLLGKVEVGDGSGVVVRQIRLLASRGTVEEAAMQEGRCLSSSWTSLLGPLPPLS